MQQTAVIGTCAALFLCCVIYIRKNWWKMPTKNATSGKLSMLCDIYLKTAQVKPKKKNSWNCKSEKRVDFWTTNISCDWKEITAWRRFNLQILLWIKKIYLIFSVYFYFCTSSKISTGRDYNLSRQLSLFVVIFSSALKLPNHNFWFFFSIPIIVKLVIFFSPNLLM